jgi:hypothetical protein
MRRIALTSPAGNWFDSDKAECIKEESWHDGSNWISKATGSQWEHESLYRTAGGQWVLHHWSNFQGKSASYVLVDSDTAAQWLVKQGIEPHSDCAGEYAALEIQ